MSGATFPGDFWLAFGTGVGSAARSSALLIAKEAARSAAPPGKRLFVFRFDIIVGLQESREFAYVVRGKAKRSAARHHRALTCRTGKSEWAPRLVLPKSEALTVRARSSVHRQ